MGDEGDEPLAALRTVMVRGVDLHISMQTTGRTGTPYYELRATLANGRRQSLGSGVRDKRQAEWLAAQMRSAIGLLR